MFREDRDSYMHDSCTHELDTCGSGTVVKLVSAAAYTGLHSYERQR